jgi:hypothetical protein
MIDIIHEKATKDKMPTGLKLETKEGKSLMTQLGSQE